MRILCVIPLLILLSGCGSYKETRTLPVAPTAAPTSKSSGAALVAKGPGGEVRIGDDLATAKAAFPMPKGAQEFKNSLNFAILATEGWAWVDEKTKTGFEVAIRSGKVVGIVITSLSGQSKDAEQKEIAAVGAPARKAENDAVAMLVWEEGDQARFFINFRKEQPLFGQGTLTLVGGKEDLKMLNYRADDPETWVKQMSAAAGGK